MLVQASRDGSKGVVINVIDTTEDHVKLLKARPPHTRHASQPAPPSLTLPPLSFIRPAASHAIRLRRPLTLALSLLSPPPFFGRVCSVATQTVFDFGALRALFARPDFSFVYDSMHGVQVRARRPHDSYTYP